MSFKIDLLPAQFLIGVLSIAFCYTFDEGTLVLLHFFSPGNIISCKKEKPCGFSELLTRLKAVGVGMAGLGWEGEKNYGTAGMRAKELERGVIGIWQPAENRFIAIGPLPSG